MSGVAELRLGENPREPDARIVVRPNESCDWAGIGSLIADIAEVAVAWGPVIEVDTSDRTRPGEMRGASPIGSIVLVLAGVGLGVLRDTLKDVLVDWIKERRRTGDDPAHLVIYGPNEEVLWEAYVDDDGTQPP